MAGTCLHLAARPALTAVDKVLQRKRKSPHALGTPPVLRVRTMAPTAASPAPGAQPAAAELDYNPHPNSQGLPDIHSDAESGAGLQAANSTSWGGGCVWGILPLALLQRHWGSSTPTLLNLGGPGRKDERPSPACRQQDVRANELLPSFLPGEVISLSSL